MEEIRGKAFRAQTVRLDGKLFVNCDFENCLLTYGGATCEWENTRFSNCQVVLDGAANNTLHILRTMGFEVTPPDAARTSHSQNSFKID
jgi:hypothetical protein